MNDFRRSEQAEDKPTFSDTSDPNLARFTVPDKAKDELKQLATEIGGRIERGDSDFELAKWIDAYAQGRVTEAVNQLDVNWRLSFGPSQQMQWDREVQRLTGSQPSSGDAA